MSSGRSLSHEYEQNMAVLAMFGVSTDPPSPDVVTALQSESENCLSDILGKVEIRVDDHVVASTNLGGAAVSPGRDLLTLRLFDKSIKGHTSRTSIPLSKYERCSGKLMVATQTVGALSNCHEVYFDEGEAMLRMVTADNFAAVSGKLENLTETDIADQMRLPSSVGPLLLKRPYISFCPCMIQLRMTPRLRKLCEIFGPSPLRRQPGGLPPQDPEEEVEQTIALVHRELGIDQTYTCFNGFKDTPMKDIFADFIDRMPPKDEKATLKSLRFTLNGKILFPSSVGKQTPHALGMKDGDEIVVSTIAPSPREVPLVERRTTKTPKRKGSKKGKRSRKSAARPAYGGEEAAGKDQLHRLHSSVLEEAETKHFRSIRQRLNAMNLERTEPKVKAVCQKQTPAAVTPPALPLDGHRDKAKKARFIIHVGEVQNLYKSTKPSKRLKSRLARGKAITVDLHAMSKEEALAKLDNDLPQWVDVAMRGDHPFVIPVIIVCGKGSQVLSEAVEHWIGRNENVATAPKNLY